MQLLIPPYSTSPPDLTVTLDHFCNICGFSTEHYVDFQRVHYPHRLVCYTLQCADCCTAFLEEGKNTEFVIKIIKHTTLDEWKEILSDIKDSIRDN